MTQPSNAGMYFGSSVPNHHPAQMTVINPTMRPCSGLQRKLKTTGQNEFPTIPDCEPVTATTMHSPSTAQKSPVSQQRQNWNNSNVVISHFEVAKESSYKCPTKENCQKERKQTKKTAAKRLELTTENNTSDANGKKAYEEINSVLTTCLSFFTNDSKPDEDKHSIESLRETVARQRELIAKLVSVIVRDRIRYRGKTTGNDLKNDDFEKVLNLSLPLSKLNVISDSHSTHTTRERKRRTRTRTATGEKKYLCKRLRKDRKSPRLSTYTSPPSASQKSVMATTPQPKMSQEKSTLSLQLRAYSMENHAEINSEGKLANELMQDGYSCKLSSLRMEFARRLKSLENEFRREYESGKRTLKSKCIFSKRKQASHKRCVSVNNTARDSDWLPSTAASSSSANEDTSSSASTSAKLCVTRRQFLKRKHVRCYKPLRRNKRKSSRARLNSSCFEPIMTREASGMALQKIDRLLRRPESEDVSSKAECCFRHRALQKIHQSLALWNQMSEEMSSLFCLDKPRTSSPKKDKQAICVEMDDSPSKECGDQIKKATFFQDVPWPPADQEDESLSDTAEFQPPNNKTDPSFMMTKFLRFLPEQQKSSHNNSHADDVESDDDVNGVTNANHQNDHEKSDDVEDNDITDDDVEDDEVSIDGARNCDVAQDDIVDVGVGDDVVDDEDDDVLEDDVTEANAEGGFVKKEQHEDGFVKSGDLLPFSEQLEVHSTSDIFQDQDDNLRNDVESKSTNHEPSLPCTLQYQELSDPEIIGEVIVVTTEASVQRKVPNQNEADQYKHQELADSKLSESFVEPHNELDNNKFFNLPEFWNMESSGSGNQEHAPDDFEQSLLEDDLPKFELRPRHLKKCKPLVQMFRPLNSGERSTDTNSSSPSPSQLVITNIVSLNSDKVDAEDTLKDLVKAEPIEKSAINEPASDFTPMTKREVEKRNENFASTDSIFVEKSLARPLKNLISDIRTGEPPNQVNIVEWGLIPRRAMHLAKKRIQQQLRGGESVDDNSRRKSLRNRSVVLSSGDWFEDESKRLEKRRHTSKCIDPSYVSPCKNEVIDDTTDERTSSVHA